MTKFSFIYSYFPLRNFLVAISHKAPTSIRVKESPSVQLFLHEQLFPSLKLIMGQN